MGVSGKWEPFGECLVSLGAYGWMWVSLSWVRVTNVVMVGGG